MQGGGSGRPEFLAVGHPNVRRTSALRMDLLRNHPPLPRCLIACIMSTRDDRPVMCSVKTAATEETQSNISRAAAQSLEQIRGHFKSAVAKPRTIAHEDSPKRQGDERGMSVHIHHLQNKTPSLKKKTLNPFQRNPSPSKRPPGPPTRSRYTPIRTSEEQPTKNHLSESTSSPLDHGDGRRRFLSPAAVPSEASFSRIVATTSRLISGRNSLTVLNAAHPPANEFWSCDTGGGWSLGLSPPRWQGWGIYYLPAFIYLRREPAAWKRVVGN